MRLSSVATNGVVDNLVSYSTNSSGKLITADLKAIDKPSGLLGWIWHYIFGPNIDKDKVAQQIHSFVMDNKSALLDHTKKDTLIKSLETLHQKTHQTVLLGAIHTLKGTSINHQYRTEKKSSKPLKDKVITLPKSGDSSPAGNEEHDVSSRQSDLLKAHPTVDSNAANLQRGVVEAIYKIDQGSSGTSIPVTEVDPGVYNRYNTVSDGQKSLYPVPNTVAISKTDGTFEPARYINATKTTNYNTSGQAASKTSRLAGARRGLSHVTYK